VPEGVPQAGGVAGGQRRAQGSVLATSWVRGAAMADESSTPGLSALMRTGRGSPEGRVPRPVTELTAWSTASGATFLTLCSIHRRIWRDHDSRSNGCRLYKQALHLRPHVLHSGSCCRGSIRHGRQAKWWADWRRCTPVQQERAMRVVIAAWEGVYA
jgi:hypothetical protein